MRHIFNAIVWIMLLAGIGLATFALMRAARG
jgi:hypothetical protein